MKGHKHRWQACLLACTLLAAGNLTAQDTPPKSRWTSGVDLGINLAVDCGDCNEYHTINITTGSGHVSYRLMRWLELTANMAFSQQQLYSGSLLWDPANNISTPAQQRSRINLAALTVGPRFLFRLWQGDLFLELRYGIASRSAKTQALGFSGQTYDIPYKSVISGFNTWRLGYTYWPKMRFGLSAGLEVTSTGRNTDIFKEYQARQSLAAVYPNENPAVLQQLAPDRYGPNLINILLGICYRF